MFKLGVKFNKILKMSFNIWILQLVTFLDLLAVGLIVPLIARHVRTLGAGYIYIGLMGTIYSGFQFASGPLIGCLSDLKGRKTVLIFTLLICGTAYTIMGLINSLLTIQIIRVILGLFKQTQILSRALVPDYERSEKKQSDIFGKIAAISGIGIIIGPVIGGHLTEEYPGQAFRLIALIVGVCFVTNAGLVFLLPEVTSSLKQRGKQSVEKTKVSTSIIHSMLELCKIDWSLYGSIFLFNFLMDFVVALHYTNCGLFLVQIYGLTPRSIGYVISFQGIIRTVSNFLIGFINGYYTKDINYSIRNFHVFLVLCLSMLGIFYSTHIYMYIIFLIPLGICSAVGSLVSLEMLLKKGRSEHRATLVSASSSFKSLSGVMAPITSGVIAQYLGVPYIICAAFLVSALGCFISYRCKNQIATIVKED